MTTHLLNEGRTEEKIPELNLPSFIGNQYLQRLKELTVGSGLDLIIPSEIGECHSCKYFEKKFSECYMGDFERSAVIIPEDGTFNPPIGYYNTLNLFFALREKLGEGDNGLIITPSGFPRAIEMMDNLRRLGSSVKEDMKSLEDSADRFLRLDDKPVKKRRVSLLKNVPYELVRPYIDGTVTLTDKMGWLELNSPERKFDSFHERYKYTGIYRYMDPIIYDVACPMLIKIDNNELQIKGNNESADVFLQLLDFVEYDVSNLACSVIKFKEEPEDTLIECFLKHHTGTWGYDPRHFIENFALPILDYLMVTRSRDGRIGFDSELRKLKDALDARKKLKSLKARIKYGKKPDRTETSQLEVLTQAIKDYPQDDKIGQLAKKIYTWGWSRDDFSPYKSADKAVEEFVKSLRSLREGLPLLPSPNFTSVKGLLER